MMFGVGSDNRVDHSHCIDHLHHLHTQINWYFCVININLPPVYSPVSMSAFLICVRNLQIIIHACHNICHQLCSPIPRIIFCLFILRAIVWLTIVESDRDSFWGSSNKTRLPKLSLMCYTFTSCLGFSTNITKTHWLDYSVHCVSTLKP